MKIWCQGVAVAGLFHRYTSTKVSGSWNAFGTDGMHTWMGRSEKGDNSAKATSWGTLSNSLNIWLFIESCEKLLKGYKYRVDLNKHYFRKIILVHCGQGKWGRYRKIFFHVSRVDNCRMVMSSAKPEILEKEQDGVGLCKGDLICISVSF